MFGLGSASGPRTKPPTRSPTSGRRTRQSSILAGELFGAYLQLRSVQVEVEVDVGQGADALFVELDGAGRLVVEFFVGVGA